MSVKRELDSPVAGCSKRIRTASGTKSGKDNDSPPATIIKIKKEVVPEVGSSPTKSIQDGGERTYFARKSDPPTPKKVPERNETSESGTSCCPICQKSVRILKQKLSNSEALNTNAQFGKCLMWILKKLARLCILQNAIFHDKLHKPNWTDPIRKPSA